MNRRPYRMARRGESAEETRRRIVEATFALHMEQGIAATSMKQIAARAGVSIGAVYHHFPTYDDAIGGCAGHVRASFPFPTAEGFEGRTAPVERIAGYVEALFAFYTAFPSAEAARLEQGISAHVAKFFDEERANRLDLARKALATTPGLPPGATETLAALGDMGVFGALIRAGHSADEAARVLTEVLNAWLGSLAATPRSNPSPSTESRRWKPGPSRSPTVSTASRRRSAASGRTSSPSTSS